MKKAHVRNLVDSTFEKFLNVALAPGHTLAIKGGSGNGDQGQSQTVTDDLVLI